MDAYAASSNRRYPTGGTGLTGVPTTAKLRMNVSSLSNLSNNKAHSKPRASSASLTRRNNSRYEAPNSSLLGGSGSFSAAQQAQLLRGGSSFNGLDSDGNPKNGNYISSNPSNHMQGLNVSGGAFAGDSKGESYDQIRRNYEQSKFLNTHKSQYGNDNNNANNNNNNNALVGLPRAQSASTMMRTSHSYSANNSNSSSNINSNAYLSMRQNAQIFSSGTNSGNNSGNNSGTNTPPPEYANGTSNGNSTSFGSSLFQSSSTGKSNPMPAGLSKFGLPASTRGIANSSIVNTIGGGAYTYNSSVSGNGATTVGSLLALSSNPGSPRQRSTEILPHNFVPTSILCAKSSYSATNKGVNRVASHNKRVSFSTPLTSSTPLANPFMCPHFGTGADGGGNSSGNGSGNANGNSRYGGNSNGNGLLRPASASAALMSTATTHYHNSTSSNRPNTPVNNVVVNSGAVLTGATAVAQISNSRSESPVNGVLNSGIPSVSAINSILQSSANINAPTTPTNAPNMNKPPLFLSTIGSNQYDSSVLRPNAQNGVASPKPDHGDVSPVNTHTHIHTAHTTQPTLHANSSNTTNLQNSTHNVFSASRSNSGDSHNNDTTLPSIRTPSPRPGSASSVPGLNTPPTNNTSNISNSAGASNTSNTTLTPLFTPSNGKNTKSGMIMSNSMDSFASYGLNNTNGSTTNTNTVNTSSSVGSITASMSGSGSGKGSGSGLSSDSGSVTSSTSVSITNNAITKTIRTNTNNAINNPAHATPPNTTPTNTNNTTTATTNTHTTPNTTTTTTPQLRRKGSTESLADLSFTRIAPPALNSSTKSSSVRDDSVLLLARKEGISVSVDSANSSASSANGKKLKKRPSLSDQLAHIGANSNSSGSSSTLNTTTTSASSSANNTPTNIIHTSSPAYHTLALAQGIQNMSARDTSNSINSSGSGSGKESSFFTQSLNSAIAIGRTVVNNLSGSPVSLSSKHYNSTFSNTPNNTTISNGNLNSTSSNSLQSLINNIASNNNTTHSTSRTASPYEISDNEESITGSGSSIVSVPCKAFSIGSVACRAPSKMSFYAEHCEYPFSHPYENSTVYLSVPYRDMSAITTVGMKFRFKIPRKVSLALGDFDTQNALHLVTLELNNTSSMSTVRERVVPLVTSK